MTIYPIMIAVAKGNVDLVKLLIEQGNLDLDVID